MLLFSATYGKLPGGNRGLPPAKPRPNWAGLSGGSLFCIGIAVLLLLPATVLAQSRHDPSDVAVVASQDVPQANLSLYEVRRIFLGETRYWKSNLPVVLIVPPGGTHEREVLLHTVYRMNEAQYKQYWIGRILRGEAISAPKTAESIALTRELIATTPGCVTVMNMNAASANKVKVLKVDGKSPGDKEYPLR